MMLTLYYQEWMRTSIQTEPFCLYSEKPKYSWESWRFLLRVVLDSLCFVLFCNDGLKENLWSSFDLLIPCHDVEFFQKFHYTVTKKKNITGEWPNPTGFTAEFDWLIKGCNHTMRFNQPWITMNTQFKIIPIYITIKNRYKDILIHMVLTLITAWRQRRTFSRTFNVIDLKNALVRKNYSLGNWV